jgi:hypothetical protein
MLDAELLAEVPSCRFISGYCAPESTHGSPLLWLVARDYGRSKPNARADSHGEDQKLFKNNSCSPVFIPSGDRRFDSRPGLFEGQWLRQDLDHVALQCVRHCHLIDVGGHQQDFEFRHQHSGLTG